jgi:septal ring factor EnvC (AmiA/AmiB activator)
MEAPVSDVEITTPEASTGYTSRPGALIWSFRKSRDRWKQKSQSLKVELKRLKNRVADVTKSREQWRRQAEQGATDIIALNAEVAALRAELAAHGESDAVKKK